VEVYTIGFTKRSAADFFGTLERARIRLLVDVRLHNVSQLAGYSKRDDLAFFLQRVVGSAYEHRVDLAPTAEMLDAYRKHVIAWPEYERRFLDLMAQRRIESALDLRAWASQPTVLLCSEPKAERCHRRLILEHLRRTVAPELQAVHL
jgi:uncharacterized protein (DUF488 family)